MSKVSNMKKKWYDDEKSIVNMIIISILVIIICSQSFVIGSTGGLDLFSSIINHNSIYLLVLIYFILLKFSFGKKNFNYLNVFLMFIYSIATVTSLLTVLQNFTLNSVLTFTVNFILVIYLIHTFFRDTSVWNDYHLNNSPFNELSNMFFMYSIIIVSLFLLAVKLISTVAISGVLISFLDAIYVVLFGRYIYLYREYLDIKKLDSDNEGNFDVVREKIDDILDQTEIDEKIVEIGEKVIDVSKDAGKKVSSLIEDSNIGEKIDDLKDSVVETSKNVSDNVSNFVNDKVDKSEAKSKKDNKKYDNKKKNSKKERDYSNKGKKKNDNRERGDE